MPEAAQGWRVCRGGRDDQAIAKLRQAVGHKGGKAGSRGRGRGGVINGGGDLRRREGFERLRVDGCHNGRKRRRGKRLETWWCGLSGPCSERPLRPRGVAASRARARLSASRFGGGVVSFKFVVAGAPRSASPRPRVFGPLALRRPARDGAACRAAPAAALLGPHPEPECPGLSPALAFQSRQPITAASTLVRSRPPNGAHRARRSRVGGGSQAVSRAGRQQPELLW